MQQLQKHGHQKSCEILFPWASDELLSGDQCVEDCSGAADQINKLEQVLEDIEH